MITPTREVLFGWGMANRAQSWVYRPRTVAEVQEAVEDCVQRGLLIAHRGSGQSYGDAALNQDGAVIEMSGLDRILEFDPAAGVIHAEAGVTIEQLWQAVLPHCWWPPVVPGTARPTLGGCLAMNVHGKNHVQAGSFGEHVRSVTVLRPDGQILHVRAEEPEFPHFVGTQGLCGTILSLEIGLTRTHSGYLDVEARTAPNLAEAMNTLRALERDHDYTVAWVDCFAGGTSLGRALLHGASHLPESHELAGAGLSNADQALRTRMLGIVPRRHVPALLRLVANDAGIKTLNAVKYARAHSNSPSSDHELLAQFHFRLDSIPNWKRAYGRGGLVQYQFFVPEEAAFEVFRKAIELQHAAGVVSYLAVMKRHRSDHYPSNYSVDGYSLALDFPARARGRSRLEHLLGEFDRLQEEAGGRVYAAKDAVSQLGVLPVMRRPAYGSDLVRRWEQLPS